MQWPLRQTDLQALVEMVLRIALDHRTKTVNKLRAINLILEMEWQNLASAVVDKHGPTKDARRLVEEIRRLARSAA